MCGKFSSTLEFLETIKIFWALANGHVLYNGESNFYKLHGEMGFEGQKTKMLFK